jgi:chaperonin GroEL
MRDSAVSLLVVNRERGVLDGGLAVKAPSFGVQQTRTLEDIAVLTGGRCIHAEWGETLANVTAADLGRARQAWATRTGFGIVGGRGARERIRERIAEVRAELNATHGDPHLRQKLKERIGNLSGASAVVRVGAPTPGEQLELRLRLEAAVMAARTAAQQGVVPGGGAALLACMRSLETWDGTDDVGRGVRLLAKSLAEPMRIIVANAGLEPDRVLHEARGRGPGWAFDVLERTWVDTRVGRLRDPVGVTLAAVEGAVSAAVLALSADVLIHGKHDD